MYSWFVSRAKLTTYRQEQFSVSHLWSLSAKINFLPLCCSDDALISEISLELLSDPLIVSSVLQYQPSPINLQTIEFKRFSTGQIAVDANQFDNCHQDETEKHMLPSDSEEHFG